MSARELAYSMIDRLNDEQLDALIVILKGMSRDNDTPARKSAASLCGIFHDAADSALTPLEKAAWEQAAAEKASARSEADEK